MDTMIQYDTITCPSPALSVTCQVLTFFVVKKGILVKVDSLFLLDL